jgi:hypothetical protein|tara:strand:- start:124 stop:501 length:378 start_codon:yes stop_codon:yes gene_type:complete
MSSAPAMTLFGTADANLHASMPGTGQGSTENTVVPPQYKSEPIAPKLYPNNIDYSTRRSVLPCKGITHHILRPEPPPASAGMMPIGGNSRGSVPSMSQTGPTNLPIMPFSDPFNSQFNNPLKAPA